MNGRGSDDAIARAFAGAGPPRRERSIFDDIERQSHSKAEVNNY